MAYEHAGWIQRGITKPRVSKTCHGVNWQEVFIARKEGALVPVTEAPEDTNFAKLGEHRQP